MQALWCPPDLLAGRGDGLAAPDAFVLSAGLWHMLHITDVQLFSRDLVQLRDAAASFLAKAVQVRMVLSALDAQALTRSGYVVPASRSAMQAPPVSYFSISEVYPPKLKTEDKREHLTPACVDAYNHAIANSAVLSPDGPFHLIDIHSLTQGAPRSCAEPLHAQPGRDGNAFLWQLCVAVRVMPSFRLLCLDAQAALTDSSAVCNFCRSERVFHCAECGQECTHDGLHYSNATYDTAVQVWANALRSLL